MLVLQTVPLTTLPDRLGELGRVVGQFALASGIALLVILAGWIAASAAAG
jgi:hypothetical protein